jgi:formate hydrogenlyase subunit 3/multisubunit Na+/H+ antiporter MnhD subunit
MKLFLLAYFAVTICTTVYCFEKKKVYFNIDSVIDWFFLFMMLSGISICIAITTKQSRVNRNVL